MSVLVLIVGSAEMTGPVVFFVAALIDGHLAAFLHFMAEFAAIDTAESLFVRVFRRRFDGFFAI